MIPRSGISERGHANMSLDEASLHRIAQNGEMDYSKWPKIIGPLLERLNEIVFSEFPMPQPYPTVRQPEFDTQDKSTETPSHSNPSVQISQTPTTPRALPPVPPFPGSMIDTPTSQIPDSQPDQAGPFGDDTTNLKPELPLLLQRQLSGIMTTLQSSFQNRPPHTVQRLSELTLDPKRHYKTLPAWLRAVDRVVSVSSTADIFPLTDVPAIVNGVNGDGGGGILWDNSMNNAEQRNGTSERDGGLGSDESLGGALLTPIPWLRDALDSDSTSGDMDGPADLRGSMSPGLPIDDLLGDPITFTSRSITSSTTMEPSGSNTSARPPDAADSHANTPGSNASMPVSLDTYPSSNPLVPDRPLGAVTQGELIRMEQEAGVVPVTHPSSSTLLGRTGTGRTEHTPSIALGVGVGLDSDPAAQGITGGEIGEDDGIAEEESEIVHARGPDMIGTVDMGLVGGKDMQVRIGSQSPPKSRVSETDRKTDVNDAQHVLAGGDGAKKRHEDHETSSTSGTGSEGDYVDVSRELHKNDEDEADDDNAMQLDITSPNKAQTTKVSTKDATAPIAKDEDEDIVLVDADGATEEEREQIDRSDLNVGSTTGDGTSL